jgi:hypothetical protein
LLNKDKAKPNYTNKMWKRKAEESKSYSKEELNALMKKVVNEARKSWDQKDKKDEKTGTKRKKAEANLLEEDSESQTSATTEYSLLREEINNSKPRWRNWTANLKKWVSMVDQTLRLRSEGAARRLNHV